MIDYKQLIDEAKQDQTEKYVVGIIVPKDDKILLLQRKADDFLPNIYEFPGGGVDKDETLKHAVKRELAEETGFALKEIQNYLGYFDYKGQSGKLNRIFHFLVSIDKYSEIVHPEHQAYAWVSKNELNRFTISKETLDIIKKYFSIKDYE